MKNHRIYFGLALTGLAATLHAGDATDYDDAPYRVINDPQGRTVPDDLAAEIAASKYLSITELCLLASQWVQENPDLSDEILRLILDSRDVWPDEHVANLTHAVQSFTPTELLATDISSAKTASGAGTATPVSDDFLADISKAKEKLKSRSDLDLIAIPPSVTDAD